jgi:hypothetical protein
LKFKRATAKPFNNTTGRRAQRAVSQHLSMFDYSANRWDMQSTEDIAISSDDARVVAVGKDGAVQVWKPADIIVK